MVQAVHAIIPRERRMRMANYTQSIREILQYNKLPAEKLTDVNDVYSIASRCLFDTMPSNVIDDLYLQRFITGFALHFM